VNNLTIVLKKEEENKVIVAASKVATREKRSVDEEKWFQMYFRQWE
jgi:hypothetical protein